MLKYQKQNSSQTLAEGLTEYFDAHKAQFTTRIMTKEAITFFERHDAVHVVFGCDISLSDEMIVKISSIFGTTVGWSVLKGYNLAESKEIYRELEPVLELGTC